MTDTSPDTSPNTSLRGIDHIAILVRSTDEALGYYRDRLGLPIVAEEAFEAPPVRLTYVDAGNAAIQLIEPTGPSPIADALEANGEGVHHVCFATDDPVATAIAIGDEGAGDPITGKGRGRASAFAAGAIHHGTLIELTEAEK